MSHQLNRTTIVTSRLESIAEVIAIRKALQLSSLSPELTNATLIVESDSLNAISWLKQPINSRPWQMHKEFSSIENLKGRFQLISFIHTFRENNCMADSLAKQGTHRPTDFTAWL